MQGGAELAFSEGSETPQLFSLAEGVGDPNGAPGSNSAGTNGGCVNSIRKGF